MNNNFNYFIGKSSSLIHKLCIGQGTAKQRLLECESYIIVMLIASIPDELIPLKEKIHTNLNKKEAISTMTSFRHTLIRMRNSTASKIIDDIYTLYSKVLQYQEYNAKKSKQ